MNVGKKGWIVFGIICVAVIAVVLLGVLVLVPQVQSSGLQVGEYQNIAKQEYTYSGRTVETLEKKYGVTSSDVEQGKKTNKYKEGNINPLTVYNEPTLQRPSSGNNQTLTPDQK